MTNLSHLALLNSMRLIILLLLSLPLLGSVKSKDILDLFEETALSWTPGSTSLTKKDQKLCKKRTEGIKVSLVGNWSSTSKSAVSEAMSEVSKVTNLRIRFSEKVESSFLVLYDEAKLFSAKIDDRTLILPPSFKWSWYIYYSDTKPFSISEGYGFINTEEPIDERSVYSSTLRILIGSLGFTNRTNRWKFRDSIFNTFNDFESNDLGDKGMTDLDKAVIKLLYEDSIKPGMGIREIKKICSENNLLEKIGGS